MSRGDVELEHLETDDDVDDIIDPDRNKYEYETASKLQSRHKMKFAMLSIAAFALLAYATGGEVGGLWRSAAVFDPTFGIKCDSRTTPAASAGGGGGSFTQDVRRRLSLDEAREEAWALTHRMTFDEKMSMVQGVGWRGYAVQPGFYVGNTPAIPRLGIPAVTMQDGPQGFRTLDPRMVGTVTSWPCMLAVGATWDAELARAYGAALGREFRAKGANVYLGPGVNVHRVARNGRNGEYISGEEPLLGAVLGGAVVAGTQSEGVACSVKHFALNSQETNRNTQAVDMADLRPLWEVYYAPFAAAVEAGVASVMCSYNRVRTAAQPEGAYEHACGNAQLLQRDLKGAMGFEGWVMSDWWAVQDGGAAAAGVDQEMPGTPTGPFEAYFTATLLAALAGLSAPPPGEAGEAGLSGPAKPPPLQTHVLESAFGTDTHDDSYGEGEDAAEPPPASVAAPPRGGDGPDRLSEMVARVLRGMLMSGAFNTSACTVGCDCDHALYEANASSAAHLQLARKVGAASAVLLKNERGALPLRAGARVALVGSACSQPHRIDAATADWRAGDYYVLGGSGRVIAPTARAVSIQQALRSRGVQLSVSATDDVEEALAAVSAQTEVVVACGGATSTESLDRDGLELDQHAFLLELTRRLRPDGAIHEENAAGPKLVVLALAPGGVLVPWAEAADAAMLTFLAGEQSGNAWADVLLGDVNPSGRLPLTLPHSENDTVAPCLDDVCYYPEGLAVGWRALIDQPVAFAFGHGLSFTHFAYSWAAEPPKAAAEPGAVAFTVRVANDGAVAGAEVCQVYLAYPADAGEPPLVLRGFAKTPLLPPGGTVDLPFSLSTRDLSIWDDGWRVAPGGFTVRVGASSRDLRLSATFEYMPEK